MLPLTIISDNQGHLSHNGTNHQALIGTGICFTDINMLRMLLKHTVMLFSMVNSA